jgi:hypothetical protein
METAITSFVQTRFVNYQHLAAPLAQSYASVGLVEKGLTKLDEALTEIRRTGGTVEESEMLRLKGELLLTRVIGGTEEAETCLRPAIEVARAQEAKWWELRSSVSLARLLRDTNRRDEARTMLGEI